MGKFFRGRTIITVIETKYLGVHLGGRERGYWERLGCLSEVSKGVPKSVAGTPAGLRAGGSAHRFGEPGGSRVAGKRFKASP